MIITCVFLIPREASAYVMYLYKNQVYNDSKWIVSLELDVGLT